MSLATSDDTFTLDLMLVSERLRYVQYKRGNQHQMGKQHATMPFVMKIGQRGLVMTRSRRERGNSHQMGRLEEATAASTTSTITTTTTYYFHYYYYHILIPLLLILLMLQSEDDGHLSNSFSKRERRSGDDGRVLPPDDSCLPMGSKQRQASHLLNLLKYK